MEEYFFKTSDIEACSEYMSAALVCSPVGCKISAVSEDAVILYETQISPIISGNFTKTFKINNWSLFEDHSVVSIDSTGNFTYDGTITMIMSEATSLESVLPLCIVIAKIPEYIIKYNCSIRFEKIKGNPDVLMDIQDTNIIIKMDCLHVKLDDAFSTAIRSEFLHDYVNSGYLKLYFQNDFPLAIEDGPNRTFIAPT